MHILSTYLPPSATTHAVKCNVGEELLVVSRLNRLDVYELLPDGVKSLTSTELLPRIVAVEEISPDGGPSAILVITDYPDCSALILEFSNKGRSFVVKSSQKLVSPYGLPLAGCNSCAVSADRRHAAVAHYEGLITILSFSRKGGSVVISSKFEAPIRELLLLSFCFVPSQTDDNLSIALLHRTHDGRREITTRTIDNREKEISSSSATIDLGASGAHEIVPIQVSRGAGGVLLLGDDELRIYDCSSPSGPTSPTKRRQAAASSRSRPLVKIEWPYSEIKGCGFIDANRLLLSDQYGKLVLLAITHSTDGQTRQMKLNLLGESSSARCIAYLNAGVIFIGSETGDSHLLQLNPSGGFSVVDTFQNIAPIGDAILADLDNSGKPAIVTCSGEGHTGSLRIVRTGATVEQLACFNGVSGVQRVFSLTNGISKHHSYLLLSFHDETKLVDIGSLSRVAEISSNEISGVTRGHPTLAAGNISRLDGMPCTLVVQVTSVAAVLFDIQTGEEVARWPGPIVLASVMTAASAVCVALQGGKIVSLVVDAENNTFITKASMKVESEVSALTIRQLHPKEPGILVFIGFWNDYTVSICRFETLNPLAGAEKIEMPHVPRSIMAWQFGSGSSDHLSLLVGTGNGQIVTLKLDSNSKTVDLASRRTTSLGDRPVSLQECPVDGGRAIMAIGSRTVLMTGNNGRVMQHAVNVKGLETSILFNHNSYPRSLLLNLPTGLIVARIGKLEKLKIDSVSLGYDIPNSLAYHPDINAFAIGVVRREPSRPGVPDAISSYFKLFDGLTYEQLYSYPMGTNEEVTKISVESLSVNGKPKNFIVVGTAIWEEDVVEPSKGRILLFKAHSRPVQPATMNAAAPTLTLSLDYEITGAPIDIRGLDGTLAVVVNTILIVYSVSRNDNTKAMALKPVDQWVHSYALLSLVVVGTKVIIGDSLQSITVLRWTGSKLEFMAKDWSSMGSMNVTADEDYIIQSDIDGNLSSYELTDSDKLQQRGNFFFSENVSRLRSGSLNSEGLDPALPVPKHLLFTPGGRVTIVSECDEDKTMQFQKIQHNLGAALKQDHWDILAWRAPHTKVKTDEPPQASGFIDGDLLSRFLELDPSSPLVRRVLEGTKTAERLDLTYTELKHLIEELTAVH